VALLAVGAQLSLVNISVAVLAALTNVRENHLHVARGTCHGSVHAAQGITGLIVVELGNGPDRPPPTRGMAVLAGNRQVAMRAMSPFVSLRSDASPKCGKCKKHDENEFRRNPSAHDLHLAFVLFNPRSEKRCRRQTEYSALQFAV
jgi:hypothetical protein